jgi:hypothetical protein
VFWTGNNGLPHIPILYRDDVCLTLLFLDEASAALEATVRHTTLLTTI